MANDVVITTNLVLQTPVSPADKHATHRLVEKEHLPTGVAPPNVAIEQDIRNSCSSYTSNGRTSPPRARTSNAAFHRLPAIKGHHGIAHLRVCSGFNLQSLGCATVNERRSLRSSLFGQRWTLQKSDTAKLNYSAGSDSPTYTASGLLCEDVNAASAFVQPYRWPCTCHD